MWFFVRGSQACLKLLFFSKSCRKVAKIFLLSCLFWVLKIKNSHIASYQNFICQSPMKISKVAEKLPSNLWLSLAMSIFRTLKMAAERGRISG